MLLLLAPSDEDARKQQQTSAHFFTRESCVRGMGSLWFATFLLLQGFVVVKLSVLHLPDHAVCLLYRAEDPSLKG